MLKFDPERVLLNVRQADTDDLLDRITAYRVGMEPDAVTMIERELQQRGVTAERIEAHRQWCAEECLFDTDGSAHMCSFCRRPAVAASWGWHRLLGLVPVLPRRFCYCPEHLLTN